jgi:hypothetical protein
MTLDELFTLVTDAILRADALADLRAPGAATAYLDVSRVEEEIAARVPASHPDGALARDGAVRAATTAGDFGRARELADRYLAEPDVDAELTAAIATLVTVEQDPLALRHPRTVKRLEPRRVRRLARRLAGQGSPLPIG